LNTKKTAQELTNDEFLGEAFKNVKLGEKIWVLTKAKVDDNRWGGQILEPDDPAPSRTDWNNYTSTATLIHSCHGRRTKDTFHSGHFVVLDDADIESVGFTLEPSYVIETSPGSHQIGYFLSDPERNIARIDALMKGLSDGGYCKADQSGNNAVRVVRLPVAWNTKRDAPVVTRSWSPGVRYSLDQIAEAFRIDIRVVEASDPFDASWKTPYEKVKESGVKFKRQVMNIATGSDYHDSINGVAARLVTLDTSPRVVTEMIQALMSVGAQTSANHDEGRWQERYDDIERSVETAIQKFGSKKIEDVSKSAFALYDYDLSKAKATEWVVDGFLAWGITVIAGAPGVGKTSKIVALAALVAHLCRPDHELKPVIRRKVVYITEDTLQAERLIYCIFKNGETGLTLDEFKQWFEIRSAARLEPEQVAAEVELYTRVGVKTGSMGFVARPLIVLDTSNATLNIEDENSNAEVGSFIAAIKGALNGSPLWVIAHTAKTLGRSDVKGLSARGAGAFEGDANATAYVFQEDEIEDQRFIRLGKHRYESEYRELSFRTAPFTETVPCLWGGTQQVVIRLAYPEHSSKATREIEVEMKKREKAESKRIAGKDETWNRIQDDIASFLNTNPGSSKNQIAKAVKGMNELKAEIIATMLSAGLITSIKKGGHDIFTLNDDM